MKSKLDLMTREQRARFARCLFRPIRLKADLPTRMMLERLAKGGTR